MKNINIKNYNNKQDMTTIYTYNLLIPKYLDNKSLCNLSLVNKYWTSVASHFNDNRIFIPSGNSYYSTYNNIDRYKPKRYKTKITFNDLVSLYKLIDEKMKI